MLILLALAVVALMTLFSTSERADATSTVQIIETTGVYNSTGLKVATSTCPAGTTVYGSGGRVNSPSGNYDKIHLVEVRARTQTTVTVMASEVTAGYTGNWQVVAIAYCG